MAEWDDAWSRVTAAVLDGKSPKIRIPRASVIPRNPVVPGRGRGRPPNRKPLDGGNPLYTMWVMKTPRGVKMRCRMHGCRRFVRQAESTLVCSEECYDALLGYCRLVIDIMEGRKRAEEFPMEYRVNGGTNLMSPKLRRAIDEARGRGKKHHADDGIIPLWQVRRTSKIIK